jgi:hypothetical protein
MLKNAERFLLRKGDVNRDEEKKVCLLRLCRRMCEKAVPFRECRKKLSGYARLFGFVFL